MRLLLIFFIKFERIGIPVPRKTSPQPPEASGQALPKGRDKFSKGRRSLTLIPQSSFLIPLVDSFFLYTNLKSALHFPVLFRKTSALKVHSKGRGELDPHFFKAFFGKSNCLNLLTVLCKSVFYFPQ